MKRSLDLIVKNLDDATLLKALVSALLEGDDNGETVLDYLQSDKTPRSLKPMVILIDALTDYVDYESDEDGEALS